MKAIKILSCIAVLTIASNTFAAILSFQITQPSLLPGYTTYEFWWNGGGVQDWTSAALVIELSSGTVFNKQWPNPANGGQLEDQNFLDPFAVFIDPVMAQETYLGPPNGSIAGGAGDIGGGPLNLDGQHISASWFNTTTDDLGQVKIANITVSNDARGTYAMLSGGILIEGYIPEPASLALLGLAIPVLLRRS